MGSLWHTAPASLLLHGAAYLVLATTGLPHPEEKKPVIIDLAMTEPASPPTAVRKAQPPDKRTYGQPKRVKGRTSAILKLPLPQALPATPAVTAAPLAAPAQPAPTEHQLDTRTAAPPAIFTTQAAGAGTDANPKGPVGGRSSGTIGHEAGGAGMWPGPSAGSLKKRYLSEHFAYIRDLILKNLVYPQAARRMGWSGKVVVTFVVSTDGSVDKVKVLTGSGYQMLDGNAVETVRKAAPFPRPPVSVELVLPIGYNLE
jgi:protein TonB